MVTQQWPDGPYVPGDPDKPKRKLLSERLGAPNASTHTDAARDALRTALRDAFNAGGRCAQERIPLTAGVYAESRVDKLLAEIERLDRAKGE